MVNWLTITKSLPARSPKSINLASSERTRPPARPRLTSTPLINKALTHQFSAFNAVLSGRHCRTPPHPSVRATPAANAPTVAAARPPSTTSSSWLIAMP